jgi:hypothetical protein
LENLQFIAIYWPVKRWANLMFTLATESDVLKAKIIFKRENENVTWFFQ